MTSATRKKKRQSLSTLAGVALVILNLIAFNYLGAHCFARWDLTANKIYTLNSDTRRILEQMDDLVTVKYFITGDLPRGYQEIREQTTDLLEEFKVVSDDRVQIVLLDPSEDPAARMEAEQYGIPEWPLREFGSDSFEQKLAFMGMAVLYEDRFEALPAAVPATLEYDLLMRIVRIMNRDVPTIAFNQRSAVPPNVPPELRAQFAAQNPGRDRHDVKGDYREICESLKKQYNVETVALDEQVPEHIRTVVVANPESLDERALYYLDQFLMRGGRLALLLPGVKVDLERMGGTPRDDEKLDAWLGHFGIVADKNLILDTQCSVVGFSGGGRANVQMQMFKPFPPMLRLTQKEIDQESPITRGIRDMSLPFCSSLTLDPREGSEARILVRSSEGAWEMKDAFMLNPERIKEPPDEEKKPFDLAGILEGEFISYYAVRPVPDSVHPGAQGKAPEAEKAPGPLEGEKGQSETDAGEESLADGTREEEGASSLPGAGAPPPNLRLRSPRTSIFVMGSSDFLGRTGSRKNLAFFQNAMDYLTVAGEGFRNIRIREQNVRYVDPVFKEKPYTDLFKIFGTLGGALVVVAIGMTLFFLRRAVQRKGVEL